jgi:ribosomal protein S3
MGQKTNPNILRLGKIKEWKSKYIEKKTSEFSALTFRDLEIRKLIYQLFSKNKLQIEGCKLHYSESSLHIYISYYNSVESPLLDSKSNSVEEIKLQPKKMESEIFQQKSLAIQKMTTKKRFYTKKIYQNSLEIKSKKSLLQNQYFLNKKTHRHDSIKNLKSYTDEKTFAGLNKQTSNLFVSKILKSLSVFTEEKHNIFLNLKQVNKETSLLQKMSHKNKQVIARSIAKLRRFQQNDFFKKGFNVLYNFAASNKDSNFLAEFIALHLKKLKRPNFFFRFLKFALKFLLSKNFAKFERIQIKIKGRVNGAPRSRHRFINIGKNIPVLTIRSKINYGEYTSYTSNGTFGVKVWAYTTLKIYHV